MAGGDRIPLATALDAANALRAELVGFSQQWHVAGSVRRRRPTVADVEHVVVPATATEPDGLFGTTTANLLWRRLTELVNDPGSGFRCGEYHERDGRRTLRWGERYRGVQFAGVRHEIFLADPDSLGAVLAIRTGPWTLSRKLVTWIRARGLVNAGGHVRGAPLPDGTPGAIVPCPTEERYFELVGVPYVAPEDRDRADAAWTSLDAARDWGAAE